MVHAIVSRKEAMAAGLKHYFTGKPCKHGHVAKRFVSNTHCTECHRVRDVGPEARAWRSKYGPQWHSRNKEKRTQQSAAWYLKNKDAVLRQQSEYHKANPDRSRMTSSIRMARKRLAMPPWADVKAMKMIYASCPAGFHVDHIIPLAGVTPDGAAVCGLHCEANLRHLPAGENMSRQNRMTADDLDLVERSYKALTK